jgi:hypothetical protein
VERLIYEKMEIKGDVDVVDGIEDESEVRYPYHIKYE